MHGGWTDQAVLPGGEATPTSTHLTAFRVVGEAGLALEALESLWPVPALLVEADGRLLWATEQARHRLDRRSTATLVGAWAAGTLEEWARASGLAGAGESLVVRHACLLATGREALLVQVISQPTALTDTIIGRLSPREREVARLAAEGYTVLNIATRLAVAESTVKTHLLKIYRKLGISSRLELAHLMHPPQAR